MSAGVKKWWIEVSILIAFGVACAVAGYFFVFECLPFDQNIEIVRILIVALVGLGGLYGLVLSKRRLDKFSKQIDISQEQVKTSQAQVRIGQDQVKQLAKQVDNAQTQLFNERLGRGIELLGKDNEKQVTLRVAGIRLLDNLAEKSGKEEVELIVDILRDYINTKAKIKQEEETYEIIPKTQKPREERADIELCMMVIPKHARKYKKRSFEKIDLRRLDFTNVDFSEIELFTIDLAGTILYNVNFTKTYLRYSRMEKADLRRAILIGADLRQVNMVRANLEKANLTGADLRSAVTDNTDLENANLKNADLSRTILHQAIRLTQEQIDQIVFEIDCPPQNIPAHLTLPNDRAYVITNDMKRVFVKSDKPWSEQYVDERPYKPLHSK